MGIFYPMPLLADIRFDDYPIETTIGSGMHG
jgi:hypothetical protein